jgi:chromosome segregation ATPase
LVPELEPQQRPTPDEQAQEPRSDGLGGAWTQLRQQRSEFERRGEVLDALRQRLSKHLDKQNRLLLDRQRALDIRRLQNDRERVYLRDARLHLQRSRQEEGVELQRLQRRTREVEAQADQISNERTALSDRLEQAHQQYQTRIEDLLREKQAIADRLDNLEKQVSTAGPREAPAAVHRAAVPGPARWRLGLAVLAGFIGAGVLYTTGRFEYLVRVHLAGSTRQATPEELDQHAAELARALSVVELPARPAIAPRPEEAGLDVSVLTPDPAGMRSLLSEQIDLHLAGLARRRETRAAELNQQLQEAGSELGAALAKHQEAVTRLADQRLSSEVEDPREELQRLRGILAEARTRYEQIQKDLGDSETRLAALQASAVPDAPHVDPLALQAAEARDTQLHQDTEELRFHLNRLRRHLLDAFVEFPQRIENLAAAAQRFGNELETRRLELRDGPTLEILGVLCDQAQRLTQIIAAFQNTWTDLADRLQRLAVDPRATQTQDIQRSAEELVENLGRDSNEVLKALQLEYQKYVRSLETRPEHFQVTTELKEGILRIQEEQYGLLTLAGRIRARSDIQLESIIHRVDGLARRAADRRASIVEQLQSQQRQDLQEQTSEAISGEQARRQQLDTSRVATLNEIMTLQDRLTALIPYLEEHGINSTVARYTKAEADQLDSRVAAAQQREAQLRRDLAAVQTGAVELAIQSVQVSSWPANIWTRLGTILSGGVALAVLMHLLMFSARLGRRTPAPLAGQAGNARG